MPTDDCYYDTSFCLICPEIEAKPAVPPTFEYVPVVGWNAGANTVDALDGNVEVKIPMPPRVTGAVIGLRHTRDSNTIPSLIEHGWYFQSIAGVDVAQVMERGVVKTSPVTRASSDVMTIRRVLGKVVYLINDIQVYASTRPSTGVVLVNACLYTSGDQVGT